MENKKRLFTYKNGGLKELKGQTLPNLWQGAIEVQNMKLMDKETWVYNLELV